MSNELTVITPKSLAEAKELATTLAAAHTLPQALQKAPADVLAIVLTGAELGLAPMQAIRGLAIIKGKPVLSADAMGALVKRRRDICEYLVCEKTTATEAVFVTKRAGDPKPTTLSFTLEQAKTAGLTGNDNWRKYPDAMLRARALSSICRLVYPDLLLGVYDPDELEPGTATVTSPPERDVTPAPSPAPKAEALPEPVDAEIVEPAPEPKKEGKRRAPSTVSAKSSPPPPPLPEPESTADAFEAEARRIRAFRIWERAKANGMSKDEFGVWVELELGSKKASAQWTREDMEKLEARLPAQPLSRPDPDDIQY